MVHYFSAEEVVNSCFDAPTGSIDKHSPVPKVRVVVIVIMRANVQLLKSTAKC